MDSDLFSFPPGYSHQSQFLVVIAYFFIHFLGGLIWGYAPVKGAPRYSHFTAAIHATTMITISLFNSKEAANWNAYVQSAYMIADLCVMLYLKSIPPMMILHHVCSIICNAAAIIRTPHYIINSFACTVEASNIFLYLYPVSNKNRTVFILRRITYPFFRTCATYIIYICVFDKDFVWDILGSIYAICLFLIFLMHTYYSWIIASRGYYNPKKQKDA